jgi:NAD(P)-dependent dehydrogenase (short-subunit alcohol dehydrogenase family)
MKDHDGCSIINIASVGGFKTSAQLGLYAVLKAALIHMTKQLAAELAPNVRVNAIAPAVIRTDFARILWEGEAGVKAAASYPLKRLGEPEDIGEAALYLAGGASWMTGQTLVLDGGGLISFGDESHEE